MLNFGQDEVVVMPLLMCKCNFVAERTLWLEYATEEAKPSFDVFIKCKRT
jgi:hypothetical protein